MSAPAVSGARSSRFRIGDRVVERNNFKRGVVKFYGPTKFASGQWVGILLDEPRECTLHFLHALFFFYQPYITTSPSLYLSPLSLFPSPLLFLDN